jgi:hypothetical protein
MTFECGFRKILMSVANAVASEGGSKKKLRHFIIVEWKVMTAMCNQIIFAPMPGLDDQFSASK